MEIFDFITDAMVCVYLTNNENEETAEYDNIDKDKVQELCEENAFEATGVNACTYKGIGMLTVDIRVCSEADFAVFEEELN